MYPKVASVRISKTRSLHIPSRSQALHHRTFLKKLSAVSKNPVKVANLLRNAKSSELKAITEVSKNLLKKNYPITAKKYLKKLSPFKSIIRNLANKKKTAKQKRDLLLRHNNQSGGLPFMIPLLAPIIGSLISAGISAAV
jgi:hypothetical protein